MPVVAGSDLRIPLGPHWLGQKNQYKDGTGAWPHPEASRGEEARSGRVGCLRKHRVEAVRGG